MINRMKNNTSCPIIQKDLDGKIVAEYDSIEQAKIKTGFTSICSVLYGNSKTCGGYIFEYKYPHKTIRRNASLCLDCVTPPPECSWKHNFTPVHGWEAEKVPYKCSDGKIYDSYIVKTCPLFELGERKR